MTEFYNIVLYVMTAIFGLCVGSFLNVVIYRVPENMSIAMPPSHCTKCGYTLKWYDNIPIFSYIFLGGKCRKCKEHISPRYMLVEISNAVLWLLSVWRFWTESWIYAIICAISFSVCIIIFFIDLEHLLIFDRFQIIMAALALASVFFDGQGILTHIIGCVSAFVLFYLLTLVFEKLTGNEALGGGDIKFAAVSGLFLGWQKFLLMILIASLGACVAIMISKRKNNDENGKQYPFGPFLTSGFVISALFGSPVIAIYLSLLS